MDLSISPELLEFRAQVAAFIRDNAPPVKKLFGSRAPQNEVDMALSREWGAKLFAANYLGGEWPEAWGGHGDAHDPIRDVIVTEELALADAPHVPGVFSLAAHVLLQFGSPDQQAFFLPQLRSFEHVWCQLFSEPNAGSDLASLRTRARRDGDEWVVDGQKVWNTYSAVADYGLLLARTDPEVPKHAGISAFVVDMGTPGLEVRPLREITGTSDFSEVFFDGVRLPAGAIIGQPGQGWAVATSTLSAERTGAAFGIQLARSLQELVALSHRVQLQGRPTNEDETIRRALGRFHAMVKISHHMADLNRSRRKRGQATIYGPPVEKLWFSELFVAIGEFALSLLGTDALLDEHDPRAVDGGKWQDMHLYSRAYTIAAGSSEIMRNIISERGLGLPREPKG